MGEPLNYVGIDAHARELHLAMLLGDALHATVWTSPKEPRAIERLRRRLERDAPGSIECCYEAGPTLAVLIGTYPEGATCACLTGSFHISGERSPGDTAPSC